MSIAIQSVVTNQTTTESHLDLLGVNTAGASFGSITGSDAVGTTHFYASHQTIDYFAAKGMDVIRLDLQWERLQPKIGDALNETEMKYVDDIVSYASSRGVSVDISLHNYGEYGGNLIGSASVPTSAFVDVWSKLAQRYVDSPNAIFGLMNEPYAHSAEQWLPIANAAIQAIRDTGAKQEILVPGTYWDRANSWVSSDNAKIIGAGAADPLHNFAFEVHQYLDADSSGTHFDVVSEDVGVERLKSITAWGEQTGSRLFLGEFGVATDPKSLKALDNMLAFMTEHSDVWQGGTYWAAGENWGDYPFSVQPSGSVDKPQMAVLDKYVSPQAVPYWNISPSVNPQTVGSGSDTLVLRVSEDAYKGNAQFTVSVDGKQVGGALEAHASRGDGAYETIAVQGNWTAGQHDVAVNFLNDVYDGTPATDRNLYVESATYNDLSVTGAKLNLLGNGAGHIVITDSSDLAPTQSGSQTVGSGSDTLVLRVSEDAYKGNARFTISVDGKQVGGTLEAHASRGDGAYETIAVQGNWTAGQHDVAVNFLNDVYDGTPATDRNLYVESATYNDLSVTGAKLNLLGNGAGHIAFAEI